jgi:type VI protein secretion system component Hcp
MRGRWLQSVVVAFGVSLSAPAYAAFTSYMNFGDIPGESNPPDFAGSIAIDNVDLGGGTFSAVKALDSTSTSLSQAQTAGTVFSDISLILYNDPNVPAPPNADLVLHTALISSIQPVLVGGQVKEQVSVAYAQPSLSIFLALPGVAGESSPPGASGVIQLESVSLTSGGFAGLKPVDSTSSTLQTALVTAKQFSNATLLFYSDLPTETRPDFSIVYTGALISSITHSGGGGEQLDENVTFVAQDSSVVPEPAVAFELLGVLALALLRRRWAAL